MDTWKQWNPRLHHA